MSESRWNSTFAGNLLRNLPTVNELLETPRLRTLLDRVNQNVLVSGARAVLDELRTELQTATSQRTLPAMAELAERIARRIAQGDVAAARPVINATGLVWSPALGGAPLSAAAIEALVQAARDYSSAEINLATGDAIPAEAEVAGAVCEITGAEAAWIASSLSTGVWLCVATLAHGREVIVSRGQIVELDGEIRLSDLIDSAGAILREVGATNRASLDDFRNAICDRTGAILVAQPADFQLTGVTEQPSLESLVALACERRLPLVQVIGAGLLKVVELPVCAEQAAVAESIRAGVDVVALSGDGRVGGPRSGIVVGRRDALRQISRHPMARALAVCKLTRAALAETIESHRDATRLASELPLWQLASASIDNLRQRAQRLAPQMAACPAIAAADALAGVARIAAGSNGLEELPTWTIALRPQQGSAERLAAALRTGQVSVVSRVEGDAVLLDLRSVFPRQDVALVDAVAALATPPAMGGESTAEHDAEQPVA